MRISSRYLLCLSAIAVSRLFAAENPGTLATPGKLLFEDDFARAELAPNWRVGKGTFDVKDGEVSAAEIPEDKHGAYAYIKPNFDFKDVVAEYAVKFDGAKACHLMINDSKYKDAHAGHILRATLIAAGKVDVADYKFGSMKNEIFDKMKDPNTTSEEKKKIRESIKDKSAAFQAGADLAQWHQVRVEIVGDEILVSLDGKPTAFLKSEGIGHPTKNQMGFEISGQKCLIKAMKVWEASASPDWAAKREAVIASLKK